ncbi:MAG TPA: translation initiation factor IF-3, partial [Methylophaga sp.]|nr:translation initiation factor IF-3 [Methylophaga sp.]
MNAIATDDKKLNGEITAKEVRLTGADGEQLGVV